MEDILFLLIRLGLEIESPSENALNKVSVFNEDQWNALEKIAESQSVASIVLDGINVLGKKYGANKVFAQMNEDHWQDFLLDWSSSMFYVEQDNRTQLDVINDMASRWTAKGCRVMVMKGQANALLYPKPNHRNVGDIDCYLFEDYAKGNDIARKMGIDVDEGWYKHSVFNYRGETFENHQYFVHTREGKRSKLLEKELEEALKVNEWRYLPNSSVLLPPVQWNAMFLTYHACAHFLSEGLKLKQILDWTMFLKAHQNDVNWKDFYAFCERHHLKRFADVVTAISVECFGLKIVNNEIVTVSPYVDRIMHSTLHDNEYVFGSGEGSWHNRWHLIRNLFHYRWKYEEIYQQSIYKQLWYYATGFLFKTE